LFQTNKQNKTKQKLTVGAEQRKLVNRLNKHVHFVGEVVVSKSGVLDTHLELVVARDELHGLDNHERADGGKHANETQNSNRREPAGVLKENREKDHART